jgi:hypothetical protein
MIMRHEKYGFMAALIRRSSWREGRDRVKLNQKKIKRLVHERGTALNDNRAPNHASQTDRLRRRLNADVCAGRGT